MERLLIQMLISGLVKDVVKSVSQKEVIWNEERDNIFINIGKILYII